MSKFKTKNINLNQATVISFTVAQDSCQYTLSVDNHFINVRPNYHFQDKQNTETLNTFQFQQNTIKKYSDKSQAIVINIYDGKLFNDDVKLISNNQKDILELYIKSEKSSTDKTIYDGQNFYTLSTIYEVIPQYVLVSTITDNGNETVEEQFALITGQDQMLINDVWVIRDLTTDPISLVQSNSQEIYTDIKTLTSDNHRDRLVISDEGRIMTFSVLNEGNYEHINSFIFAEKIKGDTYVTLETDKPDAFNDITSNF